MITNHFNRTTRAEILTYTYLSSVESERRTFTQFRASVNKAISPHEVDHIDFITEEIAEHL